MEYALKFETQSDQTDKINAALAEAQPELKIALKNKEVRIPGRPPYWYADLGNILEAIRLILAKHGIVITVHLLPGFIMVKLGHTSGQWLASYGPLFETKDIKVYGANITYMRRYLTEGLVGICAQDDIDGDPDSGTLSDQGSQYKNQSTPSQSQAPIIKPKDHSQSNRIVAPSLPPQAQPKPVTNYSPEVQPIVDRVKAFVSEGAVSQTEVAEMILEMGKPAHELSKAQWQSIYDRISKD